MPLHTLCARAVWLLSVATLVMWLDTIIDLQTLRLPAAALLAVSLVGWAFTKPWPWLNVRRPRWAR